MVIVLVEIFRIPAPFLCRLRRSNLLLAKSPGIVDEGHCRDLANWKSDESFVVTKILSSFLVTLIKYDGNIAQK